jgi:peptide/nickel transport system permease protein
MASVGPRIGADEAAGAGAGEVAGAAPAPRPIADAPGAAPSLATPRAPRVRWWRRGGIALAGLAIVLGLALLAGVGPWVLPGSPTAIASAQALRGPTLAEPFGMDDLGRSVLSRVVHAYRVSLDVAVVSVALALLAGLPLGLVAGYAEGLLDQLIMRPLDILMAFPAVLLAIALMSVFGTGVTLVALSLGIVYTPIIARVVRASVLAAKAEIYVEGARALGAPVGRLVLRHILPNSTTPVLVQASVLMAIAILVEAALSFLGVGVRPPTPSLGLMLSDGRSFMLQAPWVVVFPGLAIMAAVLGFNMLADGLRDWLDPQVATR